jgi:hypothetical protein
LAGPVGHRCQCRRLGSGARSAETVHRAPQQPFHRVLQIIERPQRRRTREAPTAAPPPRWAAAGAALARLDRHLAPRTDQCPSFSYFPRLSSSFAGMLNTVPAASAPDWFSSLARRASSPLCRRISALAPSAAARVPCIEPSQHSDNRPSLPSKWLSTLDPAAGACARRFPIQ